MLKKTITFNDLDGNPITEDFYFNLTKAEIAEMQLSTKGGLADHLKAIIEDNDGAQIIETFKNIISKSVGRRSEDGRRFEKSPEIVNDFLQTEAYSEMFMEIVTNADAAVNFMNGIVPEDMRDKMEDIQLPQLSVVEGETVDDRPAWIKEDRDPTSSELQRMTKEQMAEAFQRKSERLKES